MREPFNLSFAQIAELTDYQISEILMKHPADEPAPGPEAVYLPPEELHYRVWAKRGLSDEEIAEKWRAESQGDSRAAGGDEAAS